MKLQKEKYKTAKQSAVLALFYPNENKQTKIVLILRKAYKGVHSAQVGFPGGKLEESDSSLLQAALRETEEEVGVTIDAIEVLKEMTPMYIPPSNFMVHPFVAYVKERPDFIKDEIEVESIIEVLLADLLNDGNVISTKVATSYDIKVEVPAFLLNDHIVWGATAMMLSEIKDLLKQSSS